MEYTLLGVAILNEELVDGFGNFTRSIVPFNFDHQGVAFTLQQEQIKTNHTSISATITTQSNQIKSNQICRWHQLDWRLIQLNGRIKDGHSMGGVVVAFRQH